VPCYGNSNHARSTRARSTCRLRGSLFSSAVAGCCHQFGHVLFSIEVRLPEQAAETTHPRAPWNYCPCLLYSACPANDNVMRRPDERSEMARMKMVEERQMVGANPFVFAYL